MEAQLYLFFFKTCITLEDLEMNEEYASLAEFSAEYLEYLMARFENITILQFRIKDGNATDRILGTSIYSKILSQPSFVPNSVLF